MTRRRNGFVAAMGLTLIGVVFYSAVYLPRLSPEAEAARRRTAAMRGQGGGEPQRDLAPGSVWKNMGKHRDYLAKLETEGTAKEGEKAESGAAMK